MKMHGLVITATVLFSLWRTGMLLNTFIPCVDMCTKFFFPPMFFHVNGRFEQAFVNSLLSASGANSSLFYWIGLMSTDDDGAYLWDHNTDPLAPLTYTNWNKHQPGSVLLQVCSSGRSADVVLVIGNIFHCFNVFSRPFSPPSQRKWLCCYVRWACFGSVGGEKLQDL